MTDRYDALREVAKAQGLDAVALVPGANFARLFNQEFHQNERPLVVLIPSEGKPAAVVPNLELPLLLHSLSKVMFMTGETRRAISKPSMPCCSNIR